MSRRVPIVSLAFLLLLVQGWQVRAEEKPAPRPEKAEGKFVRLMRNDKGEPVSMDTSIVSYAGENEGDLKVDLVSAVHIGDKDYYDALNKAFEDYDVVLYELVAPEGTRVPKGGGESRHPVGSLQKGMKDLLSLEYQLSEVDYTKDNFVHADMSPEDFAKSMSDRGESFFTMFFKAMGHSIAQQSDPQAISDMQLIAAMLDANRSQKLKRLMARQFEDMDRMMVVFNGPEGSTIITERNKAALNVLRKQIESGKKRIAIFYGAGHMPDMEQRLEADFGLKPISSRWLVAWDLLRQ